MADETAVSWLDRFWNYEQCLDFDTCRGMVRKVGPWWNRWRESAYCAECRKAIFDDALARAGMGEEK